jgi:hypothetical protein
MSDELQTRTCRSCGRDFSYPVPGSLATRFICERCVEMPESVRAVFEHYQKRVKKLESTVAKLQAALAARAQEESS